VRGDVEGWGEEWGREGGRVAGLGKRREGGMGLGMRVSSII
jgi:hypothetical protein